MDAWLGLVGVVAGTVIGFGGQYLLRRSETRERTESHLLEQIAQLVALSGDYRDRVWDERNQVASEVVATWNIGSYRLAEARLRVLSREPELLSAVQTLRKSQTALSRAWRLQSRDEAVIDDAWSAHREAIEHFVTVGSKVIHRESAGSHYP